MAWYSYPYGAALAPQQLLAGENARALLNRIEVAPHHVAAASRNGVLLQTLRELLAAASQQDELFLLADQAVLRGAAITQQCACIERLLAALEKGPGIALRATRQPQASSTTVHAEGFEPLACEIVYGPDCRIEDGWVYFHSEDQVRALLAAAVCSSDPKPAHDDEGESLEYAFGFLKSHAALLRTAATHGLCVVYAEMNPAG